MHLGTWDIEALQDLATEGVAESAESETRSGFN